MVEQTNSKVFNCTCGAHLGNLYTIADGLQLLQVGAVLIKEGHSLYCLNCGELFHFTVSEKKLEEFIKRWLQEPGRLESLNL
jgi:hypothetical protein